MYRSHAHRMMMHKSHSIFTSFSFSPLFYPFSDGEIRRWSGEMDEGKEGGGVCGNGCV